VKVANRQSRVATFTYPAQLSTAYLTLSLSSTSLFYRRYIAKFNAITEKG